MVIPYKVKNPISRFPIATASLILINVIIYALTTKEFQSIRPDVVAQHGFSLTAPSVLNFFASKFLHGGLLHIGGNMLFLWVFGPPVEDRLGVPRYLALYFIAGLVGDLLQISLNMLFVRYSLPMIGASGCIMGVMGAYWYLFSWSTVCVICWHGRSELQAIWIVAIYLVVSLIEGIKYAASPLAGSVAHFAHIGGGLAGLAICRSMRVRRDTPEVSEAKAIQADARSLNEMPLHALQTMLAVEPGNVELVRATVNAAYRADMYEAIEEAMAGAGPHIIDKDPFLVADYLLNLRGSLESFEPVHLLRLASLLEKRDEPVKAVGIYRLITNYPQMASMAETAFYRMALCSWRYLRDGQSSRAYIFEMENRFPNGELSGFRDALLSKIDRECYSR